MLVLASALHGATRHGERVTATGAWVLPSHFEYHLDAALADAISQLLLADGAHSAHNYFKAGRDGLGVVSAARAADKAEKAAQMDEEDSVCRDNGQPLQHASYLIVHDATVEHFFSAQAARDRFSKLSYAQTSVLFDKNGGEWRMARKFGPSQSVQQLSLIHI